MKATALGARKHPGFILAADASYFEQEPFQGKKFTPIVDIDWLGMMNSIYSHLAWRERGALESNRAYRQLLPYVMLRFTPIKGKPVYFTYRRTKLVGEERLAGNASIGVGGHVDLDDMVTETLENGQTALSVEGTLQYSIMRELFEEVQLNYANHSFNHPDGKLKPYGVILDDNDVGLVHVGLVFVLEVSMEHLEVMKCSEKELTTLGFLTSEELAKPDMNLESWTQILVNHLQAIGQ